MATALVSAVPADRAMSSAASAGISTDEQAAQQDATEASAQSSCEESVPGQAAVKADMASASTVETAECAVCCAAEVMMLLQPYGHMCTCQEYALVLWRICGLCSTLPHV